MPTTTVPQVLDLTADAKLGKQLATAFQRGAKRDEIVRLLGDRVDAARVPAWLTWSVKPDLDTVGHLGEPMFCATIADEDEFYGEPEKEVVLDEDGGVERIDGDDSKSIKLAAKDLGTLTAYNGGGYLLGKIRWTTPPKTLAEARKVLAGAFDASGGDVTPYERVEAPATKKNGAKVAAPATPSAMSAVFLGDAARTGRFAAQAARKEPKVAWSSENENGGSEHGGQPVLDEELGLIFAGAAGFNAKCSATRIADGKKAWQVALTKNQSWLIGSAVVNGRVVYQATNKNVFALDAKSGKVKWTANVSGVQGSPLVVGSELVVGSGDGVLGLSLENGRKQWTFAVKRDEYKQGVRGGIALAGGTLYFTAEEKLFAVDAATRKKVWTTKSCSRAVPSVDETSVYTWVDGGICAFDRATGKPRWTAKSENPYNNWDKTFAIGADRIVVRAQGKLVAFDKAKGKRLWEVGMAKPYHIGCASPIIAGDVALCVLVDDGYNNKCVLHAVDIASGKVLWKVGTPLRKDDTSELSWYCTPVVDSKGTVFVQAYGLWALK